MIRALLLALALAGCDVWYPYPYSATNKPPIAQADPTKEADWPGLVRDYPYPSMMTPEWCRAYMVYMEDKGIRSDSLTVTNATPRTLLLEQECVVTLAKPGSTQTVALEGSVTIREEASYDE